MEGYFIFVAGREVLIKAVIQAMPTYSMSCFKIPKAILKKIHALIPRFWWGSSSKIKKIHWCKWSTFVFLKSADELVSEIWKFLIRPFLLNKFGESSGTLFYVAECYFPNASVLEAKCGLKISSIWKKFVWGREIILEGYRWRVGNGKNIKVFEDPWVPRPNTFRIYNRSIMPPNMHVSDLKLDNGAWNEEFIGKVLGEDDVDIILSMPCGRILLATKSCGVTQRMESTVSRVGTKLL